MLKKKFMLLPLFFAFILTSCGKAIDDSVPSAIPSIDSVDIINSAEAEVTVYSALNMNHEDEISVITTAAEKVDIIESAVTTTEAVTEPEPIEPDDSEIIYDKEFFANDLFIGDSITTGLSGYGFVGEENVLAKVGLNPTTALTTPIKMGDKDVLLADYVREKQPTRVYIMLGSNGVSWLPIDQMLDSIGEIIETIAVESPESQIVILSVPPVTKKYDESVKEMNVMEKINEYNGELEILCSDLGVGYIDISSVLKDEEGNFISWYSEKDGIHFKPTAYKLMLHKTEYTFS